MTQVPIMGTRGGGGRASWYPRKKAHRKRETDTEGGRERQTSLNSVTQTRGFSFFVPLAHLPWKPRMAESGDEGGKGGVFCFFKGRNVRYEYEVQGTT